VGSANLWLGIAVLRGLESERPPGERILDDPVSLRLLPAVWRLLIRFLVLTGLHGPILARRERQFPGVIGSLLCRTRYIDDALRNALEQGVEQVMILGAGFDTRVYRIPGMDGARAFEVDHPQAQASKRRALERASLHNTENLAFVPVDFDRDDLSSALSRAGFRTGAHTFFIWEGVTQYISREAIENTLQYVGSAGAEGSRLVFSYIRKDVIHGKTATDAEQAVMKQAARGGAPWRTGLDGTEIPGMLARHGLEVVEEVGGKEFRSRYLDPAGRRLATLSAERVVLAELKG
jgi:methyltransferase (TIGR00027 family)